MDSPWYHEKFRNTRAQLLHRHTGGTVHATFEDRELAQRVVELLNADEARRAEAFEEATSYP
jgi:hypothetical protein